MSSWVKWVFCILALVLVGGAARAVDETDVGRPAQDERAKLNTKNCLDARIHLSPRRIAKQRRKELREQYEHDQFGPGRRPVSTSEVNLSVDIHARIEPWFDRVGKRGAFTGQDGLTITYAKFIHPKERGAIVISHGFSESSTYYKELIYNLYERGYSVYFLDHRGHGKSDRMTDRRTPVHVDRFHNYVADLHSFMENVVKQDNHQHIHLLGHSMGGLVATQYMAQHPGSVEKLVLSAPLFSPNLPRWMPPGLAGALSHVVRGLGYGSAYALQQSERPVLKDGYENNLLTTSRARFRLKWTTFNGEDPNERNNGATYGWVAEAVAASERGVGAGPLIDVPVLVMKAGDDRVVRNSATDQFCKGVADCTVESYATARHDLLNERDEIRDKVMAKIFSFLEAPVSAKPAEPETPAARVTRK